MAVQRHKGKMLASVKEMLGIGVAKTACTMLYSWKPLVHA